ncbi:hypothetical protein PG994_006714 [Apiospora phragmitis]|uniref:Uncharacterized protein n=1 Tax=Apiospora phragmitis TaxID=2905665 RepID=A0ABR1VJR3_9PEZI
MESWKKNSSGDDVLILTPKDARTEWAPRVYSFAKEFADVVRKASQQERGSAGKESSELSKGASGEATQEPLPQRACSVKKLLGRHESKGLLALATGHAHILRSLAELSPPKRSHGHRETQQGWMAALDEALEVSIFLMTMLCFEDQLLNHGYAPVMVMDECEVEHNPPVEDHIVNAFLHLVGFEAWNREREGRSRELEKTEDVQEYGQSIQDSGDEAARLPRKKKDPIKLREPGRNVVEASEEDDSDDEEEAKLAAAEAEEAIYGK